MAPMFLSTSIGLMTADGVCRMKTWAAVNGEMRSQPLATVATCLLLTLTCNLKLIRWNWIDWAIKLFPAVSSGNICGRVFLGGLMFYAFQRAVHTFQDVGMLTRPSIFVNGLWTPPVDLVNQRNAFRAAQLRPTLHPRPTHLIEIVCYFTLSKDT